MKTTDFSKNLVEFLGSYLPNECGYSQNTIKTYGYTFTLLLRYFKERHLIKAEKVELKHLNHETVIDFLKWLEERGAGVSTRNARLAAIHAFCNFLQYRELGGMSNWQKILSIKFKKHLNAEIGYFTVEQMEALLTSIDTSTSKGRRNLALLGLLYDSAMRVQEVINLTPADFNEGEIYTIKVLGKGNKVRTIPLTPKQAMNLKSYISEHRLDAPENKCHPLFPNFHGEKMSRMAILNIVKKYVDKVRSQGIEMPQKTGCHILRHSKAMHLLEAGVNLVYIRDFLGHESVTTTEIYAKVSGKLKEKALSKLTGQNVPLTGNSWNKDPEIMAYLKDLQSKH